MTKKKKKIKKSKDQKRVDLDIRPHPSPLFRNFDYGAGLYHGKMDKYKSVKDFIDQSRKRKQIAVAFKAIIRTIRKKAWRQLIYKVASENYEAQWKNKIEELAKKNPKPFDEWFGGKDRVYIPFNFDAEDSDAIDYMDDVVRALKERYPDKCQEIDFVGGYCSQGNRKQRIGKLLNSAKNKEIKELQQKIEALMQTEEYEFSPEYIEFSREDKKLRQYWTDIINAFTNSPLRAKTEVSQDVDHYVVISQNPHDIAKMSTGRSWSSCMTLGSGMYHQNVFCEVSDGGFIAYLIKANDLEIEDPISRIHIRRFENMLGDSFAQAEESVYGEDVTGFSEAVDDWIKQKQKNIAAGIYTRMGGSYSDSFESSLTVAPTSPENEKDMALWLAAPEEIEGSKITYWTVIDDFRNSGGDLEEFEDYFDGIPSEKNFTDESEAHKWAQIMNESEMKWNLDEAIEREALAQVGYDLDLDVDTYSIDKD